MGSAGKGGALRHDWSDLPGVPRPDVAPRIDSYHLNERFVLVMPTKSHFSNRWGLRGFWESFMRNRALAGARGRRWCAMRSFGCLIIKSDACHEPSGATTRQAVDSVSLVLLLVIFLGWRWRSWPKKRCLRRLRREPRKTPLLC